MEIQKDWRLPSGNDVVAIPSLTASACSAPSINFLSKKFRGLVEFAGSANQAFFEPILELGGKKLHLEKEKSLKVSRIESWVPFFQLGDDKNWQLSIKVVAPPYERGFLLEYHLKNHSKKKLSAKLGARGCWAGMRLRINETFDLQLQRRMEISGVLASRHLVLTAGSGMPEFSLAVGSSDMGEEEAAFGMAGETKSSGKKGGAPAVMEAPAGNNKDLQWSLSKDFELAPGGDVRWAVLFALGLEPVSAAATCVEMRRQGLESLWSRTVRFLSKRQRKTEHPELDDLLNWNLLFNYFYASGVTLDSEEFICLTSRSPHYYVSGAYWDRDSMLWSLPAVLMVDSRRARQMLEYAFGTQGRNIGTHSRFIDGVVLEPGFELDELCAPVLALASYTRNTGDTSLVNDFALRKVFKQIERSLQMKKHPNLALYETTSGPSDDFEPMSFLTYDNVLVWRYFLDMAEIKEKSGREQEGKSLREQAEKVRTAIWQHLTAEGPRGRMFVWASDLRGQKRFYTEPAGCLQLLPYWGFCDENDQIYKNTVAWLRSKEFQYSFAGSAYAEIGCSHSPHPWVLGICNSLLSGRHEEARKLLVKLSMDGGLACEAFSEKDGKPVSGEAFATAAGFLAWALWKAFGKTR